MSSTNLPPDHSFTDWLFAEAAKGAADSSEVPQPEASEPPTAQGPSRDPPPHLPNDSSRKPLNAPRTGIYQQAISQVLPPSASSTAHKRTASARSPSPSHPNKVRRTDVPTGPRAMLRDGSTPNANPRSLLDRVGGPAPRNGGSSNGFTQHDDIQARIENITNTSPDPNMMMGFNGMGGMDMNAMAAAGMANPLMLQELMMNQMALMAQFSGMVPNQFAAPGFPGQNGMPGDMGMWQQGMNGFQGPPPGGNGHPHGNGRGRGRGGRGNGRGRGGMPPNHSRAEDEGAGDAHIPIAAPTPTPATATTPSAIAIAQSNPAAVAAAQQRPGFVLPDRPQSPTLCKFGPKCTNAHCRYSHPSPVATAESGVVLSNEACDKGKDCADKDCIKAHVSPAVRNPQGEYFFVISQTTTLIIAPLAAEQPNPAVQAHHAKPHPHSNAVPCRFGAGCTRPNCSFTHPSRAPSNNNHFAQQCHFGTGCTRATCQYQHPEGRVLPSSFHRGLATTGPSVNVSTPEAGSMGGPSHHKSVNFKNSVGAGVREKLAQQMKEIEERKKAAEQAVQDAEAAASKKDETKSVAITA